MIAFRSWCLPTLGSVAAWLRNLCKFIRPDVCGWIIYLAIPSRNEKKTTILNFKPSNLYGIYTILVCSIESWISSSALKPHIDLVPKNPSTIRILRSNLCTYTAACGSVLCRKKFEPIGCFRLVKAVRNYFSSCELSTYASRDFLFSRSSRAWFFSLRSWLNRYKI